MQIRRALPADAAALAEFAARTFEDTFAADNEPENLAAHLASAYGLAQQSRELADANWITVVAESGPTLAGYAQLRRITPPSCVTAASPIELYRFYVDKPWHGTGLGRQLMTAVIEAAADLGGRHVWLGVWERNPRARAFYAKCGFVDVGSQDFFVGPDRQTDRVLVTPVGSTGQGRGAIAGIGGRSTRAHP